MVAAFTAGLGLFSSAVVVGTRYLVAKQESKEHRLAACVLGKKGTAYKIMVSIGKEISDLYIALAESASAEHAVGPSA